MPWGASLKKVCGTRLFSAAISPREVTADLKLYGNRYFLWIFCTAENRRNQNHVLRRFNTLAGGSDVRLCIGQL